MLQRVLTGAILVYFGAWRLFESTRLVSSLPYVLAAIAGVLLVMGLWTPIAGMTVAVVEFWIFANWSANPLTVIMLAGLGATVAMIGPGRWSVDATLYGRKHLADPRR